MILNSDAMADSLSRMLEHVDNPSSLKRWYGDTGIDRDSLYRFAALLEDDLDPKTLFILGACIAWDVAHHS